MLRHLRRWRASRAATGRCIPSPAQATACGVSCPLGACAVGDGAMVVSVACPAADACRLRALGVFEGARVRVLDTRCGMLLDVRGSRLALDATIAAMIAVVRLVA